MSNFGVWLNKKVKKSFRLVSVNALNTVLAQSGTNLTGLKMAAQKKADTFELTAAKKQVKADELSTEATILSRNSRAIKTALNELDIAEGK